MKRFRILISVLIILVCLLAIKTFGLFPAFSSHFSVSSAVLPDLGQSPGPSDSSVFAEATSSPVAFSASTVSPKLSDSAAPQSNLISQVPNPPSARRSLASSHDLPLVVIAADNAKTFDEQQVVMLRYLAEDFLAATEGVTPPPENPAPKRGRPRKTEWERAVELSDARFQAMFGQDAFNALQIDRASQSSAAK